MKLLLSFAFLFFLSGKLTWLNNFDEAKKLAKTKHEYILLNFSGSDWCIPCIRMHTEIFNNDFFVRYADDHLILVNADFPRLRKNKLSPDQEKRNDALAEIYNPKGNFPYTLLLDSDGNVIKTWEGFFEKGAQTFTGQIENIVIYKSK